MQPTMQGTPLSKPSRIPRGSANKCDSRTRVKPAPDFNKIHSNWEHKLEKNKACRKKPCTLVHEFNLTQPGSKFSKAGREDDAENEGIPLENAYDSSNKENDGELAQPRRRHKTDEAQSRIPNSGKTEAAPAERSADLALTQKLAGVTFEKDDFALKTILNNTGVAAAFKAPVAVTKEKQTVAGSVDKTSVKAVPFRPSTNFNRNSVYQTRSCPRPSTKHVYSEYESLLRKRFETTTGGNAVRSPRTTWMSPALPRNSTYEIELGQVRGIQTSPKRLGKARRIKLTTTPGSNSKASRVMYTTTPEASSKFAISEVERDDFAVKKFFFDERDDTPEIESSDDTAKENVETSTKADVNTRDKTLNMDTAKESSNLESIKESYVQCVQPEFCSWDKPKPAPKSLRITPVSSTKGKAARRVHFQTQSPLNKKNKSTKPGSHLLLSPNIQKSEQKPQSPLGKRKREDRPSPLRILSPNIPVVAQKVQSPKVALTIETLKKSSLVLQDEFVCAGVSPKTGTWSMAAQAKKPIISQSADNQNELLNTTIEDLDYSLSESILQAKQLQSQADHLQGHNVEEVQSLLFQLEKIERKQNHLQKMKTYLQEQLTLKAKGKSSKTADQQCVKDNNSDSLPKPTFQQSKSDSTSTSNNSTSPIMTATQTLKKLSIEKETSDVSPTKHTPRKDKVFQYIPALDISPVYAAEEEGSLTNPGHFLSEQETEEDFNVQYIYDIQTTPTDSQSPIKKRLNKFRDEHDMKTPTKSPTKSIDQLSPTKTIGATANESSEEAFMQLEHLDDQVVPLKQHSPVASNRHSFSQRAVQLANTPRMFSTIQNLDNFISASGGIEGNDYRPLAAPFTPTSSSYTTPVKSQPLKETVLPVCAMLEPQNDLHEHQLLKPCLVNVATQRFRDILLDEEVAMYCDRHSKSPVRLVERCPDPLAEAFMYGDDMHFIPIREDGVSSPMDFSPCSPRFRSCETTAC